VKPQDYKLFGRRNERFLLDFGLPTRVMLKKVQAEIVNLQKFPDEICYFHLRFVSIEDALRREIVVYNFHRQRNQLKRWTDPQYFQR
jgi:c-di-GMP-binding flagellar brake protein YcgR